ncbi:NAD(FAD)-utilizing dehydrogenase, partial [Xanthomonas hyacinthi DSM 19077]
MRGRIAIVGGGPAGLIAAETARAAGAEVDVYEGKGSVGRKFLIAGKGGLNLTHSDPFALFVSRYRERAAQVGAWLADFDADALRAWAQTQGVDTYVGSSGRVFPLDRKAAPLLPANCGFEIDWSMHFRDRHAGAPLKQVIAHWHDAQGREHALQGECVVGEHGIEGSLVYALAADL